MVFRRTLPTACLFALAVSGCGLLTPEPTAVHVSGRVVAEGTGAPLAGVGVALYRQSPRPVPRAETRTGPDGRFALTHDDGDYPSLFVVGINDDTYDPRYSSRVLRVGRGETKDFGDVELVVLREPEVP